jgi:hypothetical protein
LNCEGAARERKQEVTFLKKSNQKTFAPGGCGDAVAKARRSKSLFASFSSEKEALACLLACFLHKKKARAKHGPFHCTQTQIKSS